MQPLHISCEMMSFFLRRVSPCVIVQIFCSEADLSDPVNDIWVRTTCLSKLAQQWTVDGRLDVASCNRGLEWVGLDEAKLGSGSLSFCKH